MNINSNYCGHAHAKIIYLFFSAKTKEFASLSLRAFCSGQCTRQLRQVPAEFMEVGIFIADPKVGGYEQSGSDFTFNYQ